MWMYIYVVKHAPNNEYRYNYTFQGYNNNNNNNNKVASNYLPSLPHGIKEPIIIEPGPTEWRACIKLM